MSRFDVFLSHATADKPVVERLAQKLRKAGIHPFLDSWHLIPGRLWQPALEKALADSQSVAIFIGSEGIGPWERQEMLLALDRGAKDEEYPVIPVLLPGSTLQKEKTPNFLLQRTWVRFEGEDDEKAFHRLLAGIRGRPAGEGLLSPLDRTTERFYRSMTPDREPLAQYRQEELREQVVSGHIYTPPSFQYLRSKLEELGIEAVLADYAPLAGQDQELELLRNTLRLSAHVLEKYPGLLREQLWGRLRDSTQPGIQKLLKEASEIRSPWLRPHRASLLQPGAGLLRIIVLPDLISSLAILPDGRMVSGAVGALRVWDRESGQTLRVLHGDFGLVTSLAALNNRRVITGSDDGMLQVWDLESGQELRRLEGHTEKINALVVLDSRRMVSASRDQTLRVWDLETGQALRVLEGHTQEVEGVAVLDSRRVISSSLFEQVVRVWDVETGRELRSIQVYGPEPIATLDRRRVVVGSGDSLRVLDVESGRELRLLEGHSASITVIAALDARRVISGSWDQTLRVWDVESGESLCVLQGASHRIDSIVVVDRHQIVSSNFHRDAELWDIDKGTTRSVQRHSHRITALTIAGDHLVAGSEDGTLLTWDIRSGRELSALQGHSQEVTALARLGRDRVISASRDETLQVWAAKSGKRISVIRGHLSWILAIALLDDGRVVSTSLDKTMRLWDVENGQELCRLELDFLGRYGSVGSLMALDSRRIVFGFNDGALRLWDVNRGQEVSVLCKYKSPVTAVAKLNQEHVIAGFADGTLRICNVENGDLLALWEEEIAEDRSALVYAIASLDKKRVAFGSQDWMIRIWDTEAGKIECSFALDAPVTALAVIPDRHTLVAGDSSGRVHFLDFIEP